MKKLCLFAIPVTILISSCHFGRERIHGNGVIKTETRSVSNFNSIDVSGSTDVYVKQDSAYSVRVEADENLLQYIIIENDNGTLDIHHKDGTSLDATKDIKVYVSGPSFKSFEASGACDYISENMITSQEKISISLSGAGTVNLELKAPSVEADLSGAGTIALKGETKDLDIDGSGSTSIKCFEMMAENTSVGLSGAGSAQVFASVKLDVDVSGAGNVWYKGNAAVTQSVSGAGSVKKVE